MTKPNTTILWIKNPVRMTHELALSCPTDVLVTKYYNSHNSDAFDYSSTRVGDLVNDLLQRIYRQQQAYILENAFGVITDRTRFDEVVDDGHC